MLGRTRRCVTHRLRLLGVAAAVAITTVALGAAACAQSPSAPAVSSSTSGMTTVRLRFGPAYPASRVPDPLVAATLQGAKATTSAAVSAEIRGYLVDWVVRAGNASTIKEFAVLKDGSMYRLPGMRPAAAFGAGAPPRLGPEPAGEAKVRLAALASADAVVRKQPGPTFAAPVVYNYLVRITHADGSSTDVWVDPDVGRGRFFYGVTLKPLLQ